MVKHAQTIRFQKPTNCFSVFDHITGLALKGFKLNNKNTDSLKGKFNLRSSFSNLVMMKLSNPAGNYMFKVNNRNVRTRCEICSKLTIKIPERRQWLSVRRCNIQQKHLRKWVSCRMDSLEKVV